MPLIAVTYVKGRPGASTVALGLAAVASADGRAVLVECDPAGGDLLRRHMLPNRPSVVDFAAAARSGTDTDAVFSAAVRELRAGVLAVSVVVAPAGGAQARAALPELLAAAGTALTPPDRLVVADCGRLEPGSPVWPLLRVADVVLVLVRARADELAHLREHLGELLDADPGRLVVVLAPGGQYTAGDVADVLATYVAEELANDPAAVTVLGPLPFDRRAAAVLDGELQARQRWRRMPLFTALEQLLADVGPHLTTAPVTETSVRTDLE